jgi:hypothetical protein
MLHSVPDREIQYPTTSITLTPQRPQSYHLQLRVYMKPIMLTHGR